MQQLLSLEEIVDFEQTTDDNGLFHGAHIKCQFDNDKVILVCGIIANWHEIGDTPNKELCKECYADDCRCPVCGAKLESGL